MKLFMPDATPEERKSALQNHSESIEEDANYLVDLTREEVEERSKKLVDNLISIQGHEEVLTEAKTTFKKNTEELKKDNRRLQTEVRYGKEQRTGTLYHIANYEEGLMDMCDEGGYIVSSRRLRPGEQRQMAIPMVKVVNE